MSSICRNTKTVNGCERNEKKKKFCEGYFDGVHELVI